MSAVDIRALAKNNEFVPFISSVKSEYTDSIQLI